MNKSLYTVETSRKLIYVVAENLTQVVNKFPEAYVVKYVCGENSEAGEYITIL